MANGEWDGGCEEVKLSTNYEVLSTVARGLSLVAVVLLSATPALFTSPFGEGLGVRLGPRLRSATVTHSRNAASAPLGHREQPR